MSLPSLDQSFVSGSIETPAGPLPRVSSRLTWRDRLGGCGVRWGLGRGSYTVEPGVYALGSPTPESPVLVTANYKLTFDALRSELAGRDAWILALDTKGINVWCAAGKGTFGTEEIARRVKMSGLGEVVSHKTLILPQLAGPGVAAHDVESLSGYRVVYGPVRAADLPRFLDADLVASASMRQVRFGLRDRLVLVPMELVSALKWALLLAVVLFLVGGLAHAGDFLSSALERGLSGGLALLVAVAAGAVLAPLCLPWLPGRAFAPKGVLLGLVGAVLVVVFRSTLLETWGGRLESLAWLLAVPAIAAYLAMNFTGASTYTSLSGVRKEVRRSLPWIIAAGAAGACLWIASLWIP